MSSPGFLAHTAHTAAPPFNGLFFATAATVIPVLFLAIAVQGRGYEELLNLFAAVSRRRHAGAMLYQRFAATAAGSALLIIAYGLVTLGAGSEITAVYVLYRQQAGTAAAYAVLIGVIGMIIATAAGPALAFVRSYSKAMGVNIKWLWLSTSGASTGETPVAEKPQPEPGKTDTV